MRCWLIMHGSVSFTVLCSLEIDVTLTCEMIRYVCICCYQLYQVDKLKNYNIIMSLGCHKVFQIWMFLYVGSLLFVLISIAMVTNAYCIFRSQCHCCINIHSHICWCCNTWIKSSAWLSFVFVSWILTSRLSVWGWNSHVPLLFFLGTEGYWSLF